MTELYINGNRVSLDDKTRIVYTLQNNDVFKSINDRQLSYTNVFSFPLSPNLELLDGLGMIGTENNKAYEQLNIRIVDGSYEVVTEGKGIIESISNGNVKMFVVSDGGFIDNLKGKKLSELDLSSFDGILEQGLFTTPIGGFPDTTIRGFTNLIFHEDKTIFDILNGIPCIQERFLFREIISNSGYDFISSEVNQLIPNDTYLLPGNGIEIDMESKRGTTHTYNSTSSLIRDIPSEVTFSSNSYSHQIGSSFSLGSIGKYQEVKMFISSLFFDLYDGDNQLSFKETVKIEVTDSSGVNTFTKELDEVIKGQNAKIEELAIPITVDGSATVKVEIQLDLLSPSTITDVDLFCDVFFDTNIYDIDLENFEYEWSTIIPDLDQFEYVKDFLIRYGLVVKKEKHEKKLRFKKIEEILNDRSSAVDWSDKIQTETESSFNSRNYGKNNLFKSADDYKNGEFAVNNENLEKVKTVLSSIVGNDLQDIEIYTDETGEDQRLLSKESKSISPKIGKDAAEQTVDVHINGILIEEDAPNAHIIEEIDFQEFIDDNYPSFISVINKENFKKFRVHLTKEDIYNFDPFKMVYIKQEGSYFYVSKISNYFNEFADALLLKIPSEL